MRPKHVIPVALAVGVILVVLLLNRNMFLQMHGASTTQAPGDPSDNPITRENALTGTTDWKIPPGQEATTQIQAYPSARSVAPGQQLTLYVSTQQPGTKYTIFIYRVGWYNGTGARLMTAPIQRIGQAQGYYDDAKSRLVGCTTCYVDSKTGLVEAQWKPSYTFTIPSNWTTGVYLVKCVDAQNMQTYTDFDVLGNTSSPYVVVTADTTYAAYNNWGGYSLYSYNSPHGPAVEVSFDRPSTQQYGSDQVLVFEADAIHWFERQGYDLSYMSSLDLQTNPASLLSHKAYISLGHDEYWSKAMRDGVENARNHGVGLAFLEADAGYWQIRFEPSTTGQPDQTIVCYKVSTYDHDLSRDPLYGKDNALVTSEWRDPVVNRPENELVGVMFSDLTHKQNGFAWRVDSAANSPLIENTGLVRGQQYGCGLIGYEWDKIFDNGQTPRGLQIIGTTHTVNDDGQPDSSNTTAYIASSGALVFATGAIYWTDALDDYRFDPDSHCANQPTTVPGIQKLMENVMNALIVHH
jgi:hypothetical protein